MEYVPFSLVNFSLFPSNAYKSELEYNLKAIEAKFQDGHRYLNMRFETFASCCLTSLGSLPDKEDPTEEEEDMAAYLEGKKYTEVVGYNGCVRLILKTLQRMCGDFGYVSNIDKEWLINRLAMGFQSLKESGANYHTAETMIRGILNSVDANRKDYE